MQALETAVISLGLKKCNNVKTLGNLLQMWFILFESVEFNWVRKAAVLPDNLTTGQSEVSLIAAQLSVILSKTSPKGVFRRIMLRSHTNTWCWFDPQGSQTDGMIHVWYMNWSFSVLQTELRCRTNDDLLFLCRQLSTYSYSHNYYLKLRLLYSVYDTIIASRQHHYGIITWIMVLCISGI